MAPYYDEGEYTATIVGHYYLPGDYGLQLVIEIEPEVDIQVRKRSVYLNWLDQDGNPDKFADRTVHALHALGYYDAPSQLDPKSSNPRSLIGVSAQFRCQYKKNGNEGWYIITPYEPKERPPVDAKALRSLDALFGTELKAGKPADEPPPQRPPQDATAAAITRDDVNQALDEATTDDGTDDGIPF